MIVIVSNFAHTLEKVVDKTAVQHVILTRRVIRPFTAKGTVVNFKVKYIKQLRQIPSARCHFIS